MGQLFKSFIRYHSKRSNLPNSFKVHSNDSIMIGMKIAIIFMAIAVTSVPANAAPECKYEKIEKTFEDEEKGMLLVIENNISYSECESLCDNNQDCMNFEYCPKYGYGQPKMCRVFDAKIRGAEYLKQVTWFDCSAYYATCKKVQG